MIPEFIKSRIEIKFGKPVKYPKDCNALAAHISKHCNQPISTSTIKRLYGMVNSIQQPRLFTLDLIAQYAGLNDWRSALNEDVLNETSFFESNSQIIISTLQQNNIIKIKYSPDRILRLIYIGNNKFKVIKSTKSKLQIDDILTILRLELAYPLVCENVIRSEKELGKFIGGEKEGILFLGIDQ
jgi:hypothetical protein